MQSKAKQKRLWDYGGQDEVTSAPCEELIGIGLKDALAELSRSTVGLLASPTILEARVASYRSAGDSRTLDSDQHKSPIASTLT